jgi:ketosteroid isomerase-like protein
MKKLFMVLPLVFLLCFTFSCQQAEDVVEEGMVAPLSAEDVAAIKALGPAFNNVALAGDWDAFFKMLTEDFIMMPPNIPTMKGRAAYEEWFRSMDVVMTEVNYEMHEIAGYGDMAYAAATYTETFSIKGVEEPIYDEGKILTILRKQPDGSWLFSRWMWASDLPLPE